MTNPTTLGIKCGHQLNHLVGLRGTYGLGIRGGKKATKISGGCGKNLGKFLGTQLHVTTNDGLV